jgi:hypothetical protein
MLETLERQSAGTCVKYSAAVYKNATFGSSETIRGTFLLIKVKAFKEVLYSKMNYIVKKMKI